MTAAPLDVVDRLDGAALWAALPEEAKAAIGAASVEGFAAGYMAERAFEDDVPAWDRIAGAAERVCLTLVEEALVEAIPRNALDTASGQPRIPALLGMVCERCGCSQEDACPGRCAWAAPNLCTSCAPPDGAPTSA